MTTAVMHSSVPTPNDIHPNDFLNQNYQFPINDAFGMGPGEHLYPPSLNEMQPSSIPYPLPFQHPNNAPYFEPQVGLAPTYQPYSAVPYFQTQPSLTTTLSPTSCPESSPSFQDTLTPSSASLLQKVQKISSKSREKAKLNATNATQSAKSELLGKLKRKRSPNKRPPGTSFSELLAGLPLDVRKALEREYTGCCDLISAKNIATRQKHRFTNRHCLNLPEEYQEQVPNFVCPAFLALNSQCRSKAGRYDSAERHCQNCAGLRKLIASGKKDAFPVAVTRSGYKRIKDLHKALTGEKGRINTIKLPATVDSSSILEVFKDGLPEIKIGATSISTSQPPTEPEPVSQPNGFDMLQANNHESNFDALSGVVDYATCPPTYSVPVSEPDNFGTLQQDGINYESNSDVSGGVVDYATCPPTYPVPVSEPNNFGTLQPEVVNYEGNSDVSGGVVDYATWLPTYSEPVSEPDNFGTLQPEMFNYECNSDVSGAVVDYAAGPLAPTYSVSVPEPDDFGMLQSEMINYESNLDVSGGVVDYAAWLPPTYSEPVSEPGDFGTLQSDVINYESNSDVSGTVVDIAAWPPTSSEPLFRVKPEWGFDNVSFFDLLQN